MIRHALPLNSDVTTSVPSGSSKHDVGVPVGTGVVGTGVVGAGVVGAVVVGRLVVGA